MRVNRGSSPTFLTVGLLIALFVLSASPRLFAQSDSTLGTWTLNLAKSKYTPGPPPKSETRIYEANGANGVKATFNRVDAAGKNVTISYSAMYDGKDYKYIGSPDADTIVLKRVDPNTVEATLKKNGKVMQTTKAVVSQGGKVRTLTTTGTDGSGRSINNVMVFDRK
jgi:hypothetical protein